MKVGKAILTGVLLWVLIFVEVSILMFLFGLGGAGFQIAHYLVLVGLITICAFIYFSDKKVKPGFNEGLILGVVYVIVGLILDLIITVPAFVKDYGAFFNIWLFIGLIEIMVVSGLIGAIRK